MDVKKYLEAGKIVSVFGIKGEIKVQPWCDGPEFLCGFDTLYYKRYSCGNRAFESCKEYRCNESQGR